MRNGFSTVLIEPNVLFREGLGRILRAARFRILSSAASIDDSVMDILAQHQYVLLVIGSDGDPDAVVRQITLFKERRLTGRVAVVADHYKPSDVLSAFKAGANAYFVKVTTCDAFIRSLELVMLGETLMPAEILPFILSPDEGTTTRYVKADDEALTPPAGGGAPQLSMQEKRILRYLVEGDSNKVIARKIDIAEATVKVHIKAILRKVRVHNRTQAAVWAMNNGSLVSSVGDGSDNSLKIADLPGPFAGLGSVPLRS